MADATDVFMQTSHLGDFGVLIPNQKGFDRAKEAGASNFNIFFSPSSYFNKANLGRKLDQVYADYSEMLEDVNRENVRAYISCAFGCPFMGKPKDWQLQQVVGMASEMADKVVLCDTIGTAIPTSVKYSIDNLQSNDYQLALHLHNKEKKATNIFQNVQAALDMGVTEFDSSIAGLGGCPFIPGSGSNLSTNQLLHFADRYGYETSVDMELLADATSMALGWKTKCIV
jgi:hydroxymethylglutaryl-CoA lyase